MREFEFTLAEQEFYLEKGLKNEPRHCASCRASRAVFVRSEIRCSRCGARATVPFRPHLNRPVYCRTCYRSINAQAESV
jgi:CxxC-x17-CxxC domain-containing protein